MTTWCAINIRICISVWCTLTQVNPLALAWKLSPRRQAAIQIRLTGPDVSFVGDRCLLQFPPNIPPSKLHFISVWRCPPPHTHTLPCPPKARPVLNINLISDTVITGCVIRRTWVRLKACFMPYWSQLAPSTHFHLSRQMTINADIMYAGHLAGTADLVSVKALGKDSCFWHSVSTMLTKVCNECPWQSQAALSVYS